MEHLERILSEFGPCTITEILDYLKSDFFQIKGQFNPEEWTYSKVNYRVNKIVEENPKFFKFECTTGYKFRFGVSKFKYYSLKEQRFLKIKGYLKRCMFCGMPMFIEDERIFHFKYHCTQYEPQDYFKLIKVENFRAIISKDFVHGILDSLNSSELRLPENYKGENANVSTELWLINKKARENKFIESDRLLPLRAEEYIA